MNYRDYLTQITGNADRLLEDWRWLIGDTLTLWHVTKAGGALLRDPHDGSIHLLDAAAGAVEQIAVNEAEFEAALAHAENAAHWLMPEVVDSLAAAKLRPGRDECLCLKMPLALGGELEPSNFDVMLAAVYFSAMGQLYAQLKNLPVDVEIGEVQLSEPVSATKNSWWKLW